MPAEGKESILQISYILKPHSKGLCNLYSIYYEKINMYFGDL